MAAKKKVKPNATVNDALNLREEPSTSSKKIAIMAKGETIIATEIEGSPDWYQVKYGELEGFAMAKFIELNK